MKTYKVFKKRDGQSWSKVGEIYSDNFTKAKKIFADNMTKDNYNKSNNIVWLYKDRDGIDDTGFYDFSAYTPTYNEELEKYDNPNEISDCLLVTEKSIKKGFSFWSEDVYQWAIERTNNINKL